ncbi:MAG: UbiA family prenyltransferase [Planctomycetota bacterium]|nr:UbiA family prenyltransferase [Planctomycetota bacterium]
MTLDNVDSLEHSGPPDRFVTRLYLWAQLVRIPNTFTAVADVLAGAAIAGALSPAAISQSWPIIAALVLVVVSLYWTGMIWNDLNDVEQDRQQKRNRPLPNSQISVSAATTAYWLLVTLAFGITVSIAATQGSWYLPGVEFKNDLWRGFRFYSPLLITALLACCARLYNSRWKLSTVGPILMGMCRSGSLLLGISSGWYVGSSTVYEVPHGWMAVLGHGLYVAGFTFAGRREAEENNSLPVAIGWIVSAVGLIALAFAPWFAPNEIPLRMDALPTYPIVFALMALPLIRRAWTSIVDPSPKSIQLAIKQAIFSIIFFDAILTLQFAGPWPAIAVCSLILPSTLLSKYFRPT